MCVRGNLKISQLNRNEMKRDMTHTARAGFNNPVRFGIEKLLSLVLALAQERRPTNKSLKI